MKLKRYFKTIRYLFLLLIIGGAIFVFNAFLVEQEPLPYQLYPIVEEITIFQFGDISVNALTREICLPGEIRHKEGWVQHLLNLYGYGWLEGGAAIVSGARLVDLQKAIAFFDWKLWDRLWHGEICNQKEEVEVFLKWHREKISANEFVYLEYSLGIGDLIWLGSPFFDPLFLGRRHKICFAVLHPYRCPLFLLHETIKRKFVRESGQSGYLLNPGKLPPVGTEVTITIRVPCFREEA